MYSLTGRLNSIAFNTLIALTILSALNFLTAYVNRVKPTNIKFEVKEVDVFVVDRFFNEDALSFKFDLDVDLTPVMNWNTNILFVYISCEYNTTKSKFNKVTVWDQRVMRSEPKTHHIQLKDEWVEYYLTDTNKQLKDTEVTCYFTYEQMAVVGPCYGEKIEIGKFRTPANYISGTRREYTPGPKNREMNY